MRAALLAFAFLAAWTAPAVAFDLNEFSNWNREYEKLPGPMVYSAEEEPAWLPGMLDKLQSARVPWTLDGHYLFRNASAPAYLVTSWRGDVFTHVLEIHRIEKNKAGNPSAKFMEGYAGDIVWPIVPTGHDVFGDGVPMLFVLAMSGGSSDEDETVLFIRLGAAPENITPKQFGNVARVAFLSGGGKTLFLLTKDLNNKDFYDTCGVCYVVPRMIVTWNNSQYAPACRDNSGYFRHIVAEIKRENIKNPSYMPRWFLASRMNWIYDAIQAGDVSKALQAYRDTIAEMRRRGTNWPVWEGKTPPTPAEYEAEISSYDKKFLPLLQEAQRHAKSQCPLTTGRPLSGPTEPYERIPPSPARDVP